MQLIWREGLPCIARWRGTSATQLEGDYLKFDGVEAAVKTEVNKQYQILSEYLEQE